MADEDETATRDGTPEVTGYRVSPSVTQAPRESRYRRGAEIARGGLGRITEAYDQTLQRQVAIKELHHRTEQGRRRFELESLTTARLQHPAIVSVFDSGTWDSGEPYLVLQLLEGTTLSEEIAKRPTLDARLALVPNLLAIADALGYAHEQGVVHRDVKPSNIMLGKHGETVILDWGVAFDSSRPLSIDHEVLVGTPRFMSPEQARGESPVPAFDVFSLGITIATLLTGHQPFQDVSAEDIVEKLRGGTSDVPELPPEVPADLASIVLKATAAQTRYEHAGEVANDLRRFIAGQLVSSRRYTKRELFARWVRRNRVLLVAAAAVLVIGAIAVGSVIHERNAAVVERERAIARAHEMVLLEARSRLRTDPTATIAWLKEYPASAPHQEDLLPLVDEAAGRMVAKHVWYPPSKFVDAEFDKDNGLVVATHDGSIVRIDLATGTRQTLATVPVTPRYVRARGDRVAILDERGGVWRIDRDLVKVATVRSHAQLTGLYVAPDGGLKVTLRNDDAEWIGEPPQHYPDLVITDDETDSRVAYGVTITGELQVGDRTWEKKWQFPRQTWVRASLDGSHYLAIAPETDQTVTLWVGTPTVSPIQFATSRTCAGGEDLEQDAMLSNDGRTAIVFRCGLLAVYDTVTRRTIPIPDAERVTFFVVSEDGRWLAVGHLDGFDLIELATGATRRLDRGSTVDKLDFSRDGRFLFSQGVEQGVRVWAVQSDAAVTSRLGDVAMPVTLFRARDGEIAIQRHLDCALWSTTDHRVASAGIRLEEARESDDEDRLWPIDTADDGRTCVFAGPDFTSVVVGVDGQKRTIAQPHDWCILSSDGRVAWCANEGTLFSLDIAGDRRVSQRTTNGTVMGLVRFRTTPLALVQKQTSCVFETFDGRAFATVPQHYCKRFRTDGDAGLIVARPHNAAVWTDLGVFEVNADMDEINIAPAGDRVAVFVGERAEIRDLRTHQVLVGPLAHARAIAAGAWSRDGFFASSDDETIHVWDPTTRRTRVIFAPHVESLVWSRDGSTLYGSDGMIVQAWKIDRASTSDVRARLERLTTARIIDGRAATP